MKVIEIKKCAIYATKNLVLVTKIKIITKLKVIVNLLVSTKVFAIRFVDQYVDHEKKFQLYFIMVLHMTTILLSMSLQLVLKNMVILSVWVKTLKNLSHFVFLLKKTLKTTN